MFNIRLDVYLHQVNETELLQRIDAMAVRLGDVAESIEVIHQQGVNMAGELEALQAKVAEVVAESAETRAQFDRVAGTLTALITRLIELQGQPEALLALVDQLEAARAETDQAQASVEDEIAAAEAALNPPAPPPAP